MGFYLLIAVILLMTIFALRAGLDGSVQTSQGRSAAFGAGAGDHLVRWRTIPSPSGSRSRSTASPPLPMMWQTPAGSTTTSTT